MVKFWLKLRGALYFFEVCKHMHDEAREALQKELPSMRIELISEDVRSCAEVML